MTSAYGNSFSQSCYSPLALDPRLSPESTISSNVACCSGAYVAREPCEHHCLLGPGCAEPRTGSSSSIALLSLRSVYGEFLLRRGRLRES